ncbi:MAG: cysteine desulfurase [Candidatus Methanoplasma sp.]|jgi:cysteine desulfurase/selenocysteine lyase|nr:cysteine desulfurase [Candidatus Methanoplasma sp.]
MDFSEVRADFPTMRKGGGVYLDSACQSLRPDSVIRAIVEYYESFPGCGGRSVHGMSARVSAEVDETREALASFFGTRDPCCYAFTRNATEGINAVASGFGLRRGDAVLTTDMEHNSNHVPWLRLSETMGVERRYAESGPGWEFDMESFKAAMDRRVKLVSVHHASNVTGRVLPVKAIAEVAHDLGAAVLVDGAQAAPHMRVDLGRLGADFYCLSMHKMLGPSGMGVLYGERERLEALSPLCVGGGTVGMATYGRADPAPLPDRLEAGLQNYSGIAGTRAALEYLSRVGMDGVEARDRELMRLIFKETEDVRGLEVVGSPDPDERLGAFSFNIGGLSPHDVAIMLDRMDGIMIRSGMHCAHPMYAARGLEGSSRASTYLYNDHGDVRRLASALRKISEAFGDR